MTHKYNSLTAINLLGGTMDRNIYFAVVERSSLCFFFRPLCPSAQYIIEKTTPYVYHSVKCCLFDLNFPLCLKYHRHLNIHTTHSSIINAVCMQYFQPLVARWQLYILWKYIIYTIVCILCENTFSNG